MAMLKITSIILMTLVPGSCYQTESGLVFGLPEYEMKNIKVTQVDLDILLHANALLSDKSVWIKAPIRVCSDSAKLTLLCALEKSSIKVNGKYTHRQPALQEVRFLIDDNYRNRWKVHRLEDFNSAPETTFEDVKSVIARAIETVKGKLRTANQSN